MAPNDDVERPRASSAAERQKSIVSMTEFEGMDEYTALQKYILFYRDARTNPHAEKTTKKKAWWQFWKSGSPTAAEPIEDDGAVPDERKYSISPSRQLCCSITSRRRIRMQPLFCPHTHPVAAKGAVCAQALRACAAAAVEPIRGAPPIRSSVPTELSPAVQHAR
jgi:hypothetical protein